MLRRIPISTLFPYTTLFRSQKAYAQLPDEVLFDKQWVKVEVPPEDLPGFQGARVVCAQCGEGINFKREVVDRKSTRNSSHTVISYAVFCLKKKKKKR